MTEVQVQERVKRYYGKNAPTITEGNVSGNARQRRQARRAGKHALWVEKVAERKEKANVKRTAK